MSAKLILFKDIPHSWANCYCKAVYAQQPKQILKRSLNIWLIMSGWIFRGWRTKWKVYLTQIFKQKQALNSTVHNNVMLRCKQCVLLYQAAQWTELYRQTSVSTIRPIKILISAEPLCTKLQMTLSNRSRAIFPKLLAMKYFLFMFEFSRTSSSVPIYVQLRLFVC